MEMIREDDKFNVLALGIIFNPVEKKILIGRRENDKFLPKLTWCMPGTIVKKGEDIDDALKRGVKTKTGLTVKNLGAFFSKSYPEKEDLISVYFLTQAFEGEPLPGGDFKELKWISPKDIEDYFKLSLHPKLKEFLIDLV